MCDQYFAKKNIYSPIISNAVYSISMHKAQYDHSIIGCDVTRYNTQIHNVNRYN